MAEASKSWVASIDILQVYGCTSIRAICHAFIHKNKCMALANTPHQSSGDGANILSRISTQRLSIARQT